MWYWIAHVVGFTLSLTILLRKEWDLQYDADAVDFFKYGFYIIVMSVAWPITLVILGFIALGACVRHRVTCPDCKDSPKHEGIGGRESVCSRCEGSGQTLLRAYETHQI